MNNKSNLLQFLNNVLVFIALEVISIVLITNNGVIQKYKIMGWIRSSQTFFWNTEESFKYYFNLQEENDRLLEENKSLRDVLVKYESLESYSDSLLLSTEPCYEYIPATIVKRTTGRQRNYLVLDKGTDNGIEDGMGVVTSNRFIRFPSLCICDIIP